MPEVITPEKLSTFTVALIGNPNVGKTTIFNRLTGLRQKVGNYPGVTVDKRYASVKLGDQQATIIDLPGTYSIYPNSEDEVIVHRVLNGLDKSSKPDFVLAVVDMSSMERGLFLVTQIMDLGLPMAVVLNMADTAEEQGIKVKAHALYKALGVPVIQTNARSNKGINGILDLIGQQMFEKPTSFLDSDKLLPAELSANVREKFTLNNTYQAYQLIRFHNNEPILSQEDHDWLHEQVTQADFDLKATQIKETQERYAAIQQVLEQSVEKTDIQKKRLTDQLDKLFLHKIGGYAIFLCILLLIFQAVFAWSAVPMDLIDGFFARLSGTVAGWLPEGVLTDLITEGIIPGIGGVVIFIPQIALLFAFLGILEDTGYMSRVVFLMDRIMRPFGLNGKSVVPLISGIACAIPGIMASRNIGNWKDRLITIMVTPLMSCSARLPVYVILIGIAVPATNVGPFGLQALVMLGMYLLGVVAVLVTAWILKMVLHFKERSYLMVEMPMYRLPRWKDVLITMYSKSKTFVFEAGKVILAISIVLWVLASYGPSSAREEAIAAVEVPADGASEEAMLDYRHNLESAELESSYIGIAGQFIEPAIRPLGYDWKIGIALITSFAAREVFVSTMATLYSVGSEVEDELTIQQKLKSEVNPNTGEAVFNLATAISLMVFYAFAMQCMSTLAVVYRETKGWKWPVIQTVYMTALAYVSALIAYQLFS
ncbi:ferrous iron transport protein B [Echinicola vietnamensis]|uniref:Ferrous iron transport protein B n=1 Tax=Echinicola vietnamensis (strain DSM 17526 / LMG 23754 / KMM 6221) TaxID=926556 RepID=L0FTE1_ECHVK|nr:ferrous iron transport protein B [Echinicola vietnamensis]AGA77179.1 ferrous iron transporter FeoB [Echinicola vietnamensis DSM 17526]